MTGFRAQGPRVHGGVRASVIAVALLWAMLAPPGAQARFEERPLDVPGEKYFDLGVTDVDGDSDYDIFSSNHNYPNLLQINDGRGGFTPAPPQAGFVPMPQFPGIEDLFHPPSPVQPGLYLYTARADDPSDGRGRIIVQTVGLPAGAQVELGFTERRVVAGASEGARIEIGRRQAGFGAKARIEAGPDATAVLIPLHLDLPIRVRVSDGVPLEQIRVGSELVQPAARGFDLRFRDRHGIAWADYDSDGASDAFIAAGGLSTEIGSYEAVVADELLLGGATGRLGFKERYGDSDLRKGDCRAREAASFDYNLDHKPDLFIACEGELPRLALGMGKGRFRDRSGLVRIVGSSFRGPAYRWLDLDHRDGLELVVATEEGMQVFERDGAAMRLAADLDGRHSRGIGSIAVGDFDADGDPDLLVPSAGGSTLYTNRRGELTPRNPRRFGLPGARVRAASWVDYDNDGLLDLDAYPLGLYRGTPRGRFQRTSFLRLPEPNGEARVSWFDADGDGDLEPVSVARVRDSSRWVPRLYENVGRTRHWLAVDLERPGGDPRALGARVRIRTRDRTSTSWVGAGEGARFSSGNYRVHFGLAGRTHVRSIKVDWPDGTRQRIKDPKVDRVHLVER